MYSTYKQFTLQIKYRTYFNGTYDQEPMSGSWAPGMIECEIKDFHNMHV